MSPPTSRKQIYFGRFVSTPTPDELLIRTGAVLVSSGDGHGVIETVDWTVNGPNDAISKFGEEVGVVTTADEGFFFPGFIDTHIHASQYPNAGIFGKSTLLDWLTTYTFPLESSLGSTKSPMYAGRDDDRPPEPLVRAKNVYNRVVARSLAHGTTTAAYYATIHVDATNALADIAFERGQRAFVGRVCMDHPDQCPEYYRDASTEATMAAERECVEYCRTLDPSGVLLAPIITPRFAISCRSSTLSALGKLAKDQDLRIQTHISENVNEVELVRLMFPDHKSYADVYDAHGLLTARTILAHAVHLSDEEMKLIKSRGTKVSHCPASNSALGSGFCPVRKLLDQGIDVGLGTDVSGGFSLSVLEAVRQACLVSRHVGFVNGGDSRHNIGVTEGLYLATMGGAKVAGMEGKLGGFEEGMLWDVQEIGLGDVGMAENASGDVDIFGWEDWDDRVAKWVWSGDDRNVKRVWVGGRLVHTGG